MDWIEFYHNIKEPIPQNAQKPFGIPVDLCKFIDSNHKGGRSGNGVCSPLLFAPHERRITYPAAHPPNFSCLCSIPLMMKEIDLKTDTIGAMVMIVLVLPRELCMDGRPKRC